MKYDDASHHYEGDFPKDLPPSAGATHIGMFLAWAILKGFAGSLHIEHSPKELKKLQSRQITPGQFVIEACDEKFTEEELNEEGNAFAKFYFNSGDAYGPYLKDYVATLEDPKRSVYHIADTWENFGRLAPVIESRFKQWKA
jgi:hypothetical protein